MEQGLIINSMDYQENSKIIYLLTNRGKKSLLVPRAKRIKSSLINETQNITLVNFETSGNGSLPRAKSLEAVNYYLTIKDNAEKSFVASYVLELLYRFVDATDNPSVLYAMVITFFDELARRNDIKLLLLQFRIKILYFLGIAPSFKVCVCCGTSKDLYGLSIHAGGYECILHRSSDNLGPTASKIISLLYLSKTFDITLDDLDVVDYISEKISSYYDAHLDEKLKGDSILKSLNLI